MNKKLIIWLIIIIVLLVLGSFVYASLKSGNDGLSGELSTLKASCTDTDGGKNYTIQGTVSKGTTSYTDNCTSAIYLKEYYCYGDSIKSISFSCLSISRLIPFECKDGACVRVCTSESNTAFCTRLGKRCGNVTANDNCGTSRTVNCGTCKLGYFCSNGNCIPEPNEITTCGDGECIGSASTNVGGNLAMRQVVIDGRTYTVGGYGIFNSSAKIFIYDANHLLLGSKTIMVNRSDYVGGLLVYVNRVWDCDGEGYCANLTVGENELTCPSDCGSQVNCTDSDVTPEYPDGLNYYLRGLVTTRDEAVWDSCNGTMLYEGTCDEAGGKTYNHVCPSGNCTNGACINQTG